MLVLSYALVSKGYVYLVINNITTNIRREMSSNCSIVHGNSTTVGIYVNFEETSTFSLSFIRTGCRKPLKT